MSMMLKFVAGTWSWCGYHCLLSDDFKLRDTSVPQRRLPAVHAAHASASASN